MKMNRLVPMLPVPSMPASVEFYQKLGFSVEQRNDDWGWAMLSLDGCQLMVDQSINTQPRAPRQSLSISIRKTSSSITARRGRTDCPSSTWTLPFMNSRSSDSTIQMAIDCGLGRTRRRHLGNG